MFDPRRQQQQFPANPMAPTGGVNQGFETVQPPGQPLMPDDPSKSMFSGFGQDQQRPMANPFRRFKL